MIHHVIRRGFGGAVLLLIGALLPACSSTRSADSSSLAPPFLETPVAPRPATSHTTIVKGKQVYDANCVQCHGSAGRGDGYGAPFLVPAPRDLTAG